jgi:hypothetical protein
MIIIVMTIMSFSIGFSCGIIYRISIELNRKYKDKRNGNKSKNKECFRRDTYLSDM